MSRVWKWDALSPDFTKFLFLSSDSRTRSLMPHLAERRERQIAIEVSVADDDKWVEKREGELRVVKSTVRLRSSSASCALEIEASCCCCTAQEDEEKGGRERKPSRGEIWVQSNKNRHERHGGRKDD